MKLLRWPIVVGAILFLWATLASFLQTEIAPLAQDGRHYYAWTVSFAVDRDLDCADQYANPGIRSPAPPVTTATGRTDNRFPIGTSVLWLPFFALGSLISLAVEPAAVAADPASFWHLRVTLWGSVCFGFGAAMLAFGVARRRYPIGPAYAAAALALACGPILLYVVFRGSYSHAASALTVAALWWRWDRDRGARTVGGWLLLGAHLGVAMLVRPQNLVFALPLVVEGALTTWRRPRAVIGPLLGAACAFLVFLPQLYVFHWLYGSWFTVPQSETGWVGYMAWSDSRWSETLFSSRNGLFPWAPLWAAGMLGLVLAARRDRGLVAALVGTFALTAYVNGAAQDWWGMGAFGGRRYDGHLVAVTLGLAAWIDALVRVVRERAQQVAAVGLVAGTIVLGLVGLFTTLEGGTTRTRTLYSSDTATSYASTFNRILHRTLWRLGNPLSWPGSIAFALSTGAPAASYDVVVGEHLLGDLAELGEMARDDLLFGVAKHHPLLVRGFGAAEPKGAWREVIAPETRFLVPLNTPRDVRIVLEAEAVVSQEIVIRWNGVEVARGQARRGDTFRLEARVRRPPLRRSINIVEVSHLGAEVPVIARYRRLGLEEIDPASP